MGVIKKHYENVRLSDEQKAEIKYALKDRFPQYARTGSKREVINIENERITDTGARVKTHSKLKAGIAATAAAALLFTAGVAAIHRTETGISPGSANTGYDGRQTGYIDDSSSEYFADAKTIYNHLVETTVGFEVQGIRYVEDCAVINRDTLLAAREQNMICDPQEGSLVNAFELVAMLDENLKEEEDIDLGELDFEIWIDTNLMSPQYVFIYPDESRSSWYSYPRYEEKQSGYIEDEESEYYMLARTYNNCIAKIVANSEINGISFDEDCFVISRETVLEARIKGIVPTEDDYELNALELAAMLDNDLAARGMDPGEVDFEILIDLSDDEPIYVLVYPDDTHESWYSCPAYETESDGKVECTTVIDDNDEPQEIEIPEGYLDDIESVHFAQATEIHDTFFKVLAEAELEGQEFYDMFAKIFEQKLTDTYGDELANMDFEIAYGELDEVIMEITP